MRAIPRVLSSVLMLTACTTSTEREDELARRVADLEAALASLQADHGVISQNEVRISALEDWAGTTDTRLRDWNDEALYVWDGAGRPLGKLLDKMEYGGNTGVRFVDSASGLLVSTIIAATNTDRFHFENPDCTGRAFTSAFLGPLHYGEGFLLQSTGQVLRLLNAPGNLTRQSSRLAAGGSCEPEPASSYSNVPVWAPDRTIAPFTQGIVLAPMPWD